MTISSEQITTRVNRQPNPDEAEFKLWQSTRYLVAQEPASKDFTDTVEGYYNGRMVIPGPKADPKLVPLLTNVNDFGLIKEHHYIRFTDNLTTQGADDSVGRAIFTIMSKAEADEYEEFLRNGRKGVHRSPA